MNKANNHLLLLFFAVGGILCLSNDLEYPSFFTFQKRTDILVELNKSHSINQTVLLTEPYFNSIRFPVEIRGQKDIPQSTVSICLTEILAPSQEPKCKDYPLPLENDVSEIVFSFPVQSDSLGKRYRISIQTNAPSSVLFFWSSFSDSYPDGSLFINSRETSRDLAFFTSTRPSILMLIKGLTNSMSRLFLMAEFFIVYLLFGYFILTLLSIDLSGIGIVQHMILYNSIGLAFFPVFLFSLGLLNVHLTRYVLIWALLCIVGLFLLFSTNRMLTRKKNMNSPNSQQKEYDLKRTLSKITLDRYDIIFFVLFILAVFTRLLQVKDILVPNWVDGLVHQNILDGLLANGIIPVNQIYHIGFHLNAYFVQTLWGSATPETTLVFGQWLSVASGMTFYFLAQKFFDSKLVSLLCLAFYWFLSPFPAYLVSWGRYPFLMGLTLLPVAITTSLEWFRSRSTRLFFLSSLLAVSLLVTHYSLLVTWAIFLLSFITNITMRNRDKYLYDGLHKISILKLVVQICSLFLLCGLFFYPKVSTLARFFTSCHDTSPYLGLCVRRIVSTLHITNFTATPNEPILIERDYLLNFISHAKSMDASANAKYVFTLSVQNGGMIILIGGIIGGVFSFRVNRKWFCVLGGWILFLFLFSSIQILLLGVAIPDTKNILIFLSIPLTLLCGFTMQHFLVTKECNRFLQIVVWGGLIGLILIGAYGSIGIVNTTTTLFNREDQEALKWIDQNVGAKEIVLINSFLWGGWYIPSDGGGWIAQLTGKKVLFASSKKDFADIQALIRTEKIQYVYLGCGYGKLKTRLFENSGFELVYRKDGINIYKVLSRLGE